MSERISQIHHRISKVLKRYNIRVTHKPVKTLSSILPKPKDKFDRDSTTCVVYKIKCRDCSAVYIGQTARALKTKIRENSQGIARSDKDSLLVEHHLQTQHNIDLDNVQIIDRSEQWSQRLILEAWHSMCEPTITNKHTALPSVYKCIVNS